MASIETVEATEGKNETSDISPGREALRTAALIGFLSGSGGMIITLPLASFMDENFLYRSAIIVFNFCSFSTAAFISCYRSEMRLINKQKLI